jgi:hypothetical protein
MQMCSKIILGFIFFLVFQVSAQNIRLRAKFQEIELNGVKTQSESDRLLELDLDDKFLRIYGNPTERFDIYESFEIDEQTFMFPSLDKDGKEFAIELFYSDEFIFITIQDPAENPNGTFDHRQFVCKRIKSE